MSTPQELPSESGRGDMRVSLIDRIRHWQSGPHKTWEAINRVVASAHASVKEVGERRRAELQAWIALILAFFFILGALASFATRQTLTANEGVLVVLTAVMLAAYGLSRSPYYGWGGWLITGSVVVAGYGFVLTGQGTATVLDSFIPLAFILGSILLTPWSLLFWVVVGVLTMFFMPASLGLNVGTLSGTYMTIGSLLLVSIVFRNSVERRRLSELRSVNDALQHLQSGLEQRVSERTRDLSLASDIGQVIAQLRDLDTLLRQAVNLVREHFDLYFVQVYLTDPSGRTLIHRAGTGEVGAEFLRRGQRLPVGPGSLNGRAAAERKPVIVADTSKDASFRSNPWLPNTRSEMVIPLIVAERVVGVLDLQSSQVGALSADTLPAFQAMAGQLAVAINNAALLQQLEQSRSQTEAQVHRQVEVGWQDFLNGIDRSERLGFVYDQQTLRKLSDPLDSQFEASLSIPIQVLGAEVGKIQVEGEDDRAWTTDELELVATVAGQASRQLENLRLLEQAERYRRDAESATHRLTREGWQDYLSHAGETAYAYDQTAVTAVPTSQLNQTEGVNPPVAGYVQPLLSGEQTVGEFYFEGVTQLDPETEELVKSITQALGDQLESLRLSEQTQKALAETQSLYRFGSALGREMDLQAIYQTIAQLVVEETGFSGTWITEYDRTNEALRGTAGVNLPPERILMTIPISQKMPTSFAALSRQTIVINNPLTDERMNDVPADVKRMMGKSIAVPLMVGSDLVGVMAATRSQDSPDIGEHDVRLLQLIATQASNAIQRINLFNQIQTALTSTQESEQLVRTIIDSTPDWIYIRDQAHCYRLVNKGYSDSLHIPADNFMGKDDLELGFPEDLVKGNPVKGIRGFWTDDQAVMESGQPMIIPNDPATIDGEIHIFNTYKTPLRDADGKVWGVLAFARDVTERERVQAALTQRARELNQVAELGTRISSILDPIQMLQTVSDLMKDSFNLYHAHIYLLNDHNDALLLSAGAGDVGRRMVAQGWQIPLDRERSLVARAARSRQGVIVNDVRSEPDFLPNEFLPETRSEMAVPMIVGDRVLGVVDIQSIRINRFSDEDVSIQTVLASQIAVALQNARTYALTQQQAEHESLINAISQRIQSTTSVENALQVTIRELGRALGAKRTTVQLNVGKQNKPQ